HTRFSRDWSSDVCSSDLAIAHNRQKNNDRIFVFIFLYFLVLLCRIFYAVGYMLCTRSLILKTCCAKSPDFEPACFGQSYVCSATQCIPLPNSIPLLCSSGQTTSLWKREELNF